MKSEYWGVRERERDREKEIDERGRDGQQRAGI
jgi:hypothetical protein